jgi:hypothetical protein
MTVGACKRSGNSQGANLNVLCTSKRVAWRQVDAVGEAGTLRAPTANMY